MEPDFSAVDILNMFRDYNQHEEYWNKDDDGYGDSNDESTYDADDWLSDGYDADDSDG